MKNILQKYEEFIRANLPAEAENSDRDLRYWQDRLFLTFLVYCLPVSLIALLPGVLMALKEGFLVIAAVDLVSFGLIMIVTFAPRINMRSRKIGVIAVFYILAV